MDVILREMTAEEFEAFSRYSIEHQAAEVAAGENQPYDWAYSQVRNVFAEMLPHGTATEGNHLFTIVRTSDGADVGVIWYFEETNEDTRQAFICDFVIREPFRRTGCGTAALRAAELDAKERGCAECVLFVADRNAAAAELYEKCGYTLQREHSYGKYLMKTL